MHGLDKHPCQSRALIGKDWNPESWDGHISVDEHLDPSDPLNVPAQTRSHSPWLLLLKTWTHRLLPLPKPRVKLQHSPHWHEKVLFQGEKAYLPKILRDLANMYWQEL